MTPSAVVLLALVAWTILLVILLAVYRVSLVQTRKRSSPNFSPMGDDVEGYGRRLTRAHANCYENLPLVGAVLLYAIATSQTAATDGLAMIFLGARILQSIVHLISTSRMFVIIRFAFYVVQVCILLYWIVKLAHLV